MTKQERTKKLKRILDLLLDLANEYPEHCRDDIYQIRNSLVRIENEK